MADYDIANSANQVANAAGNLASGYIAADAQESANQTNIDLQRENQAWQKEMWELNNEYNTPKSQIDRYLAAGLNPNLIYGNGSASAGNSGSPARSPGPARVEPVIQGLGLLSNLVTQQMEINRQIAQTENIKANTAYINNIKPQEAGSNIARNYSQRDVNQSLLPVNQARIRQIDAQIDNLDSQTLYNESRTTGQDTYNAYAERFNQSKLDTESKLRELNEAQIRRLSETTAQAWAQLSINQSDLNNKTRQSAMSVYKVSKDARLTEELIRRAQLGATADELKNAILDEEHDYRHVNAFFGALGNATGSAIGLNSINK